MRYTHAYVFHLYFEVWINAHILQQGLTTVLLPRLLPAEDWRFVDARNKKEPVCLKWLACE